MFGIGSKLREFSKCESGVLSIEYSLIAAGIGVSIIAGAGVVGGKLSASLSAVSDALGGGATEPPQPPPADPPKMRSMGATAK